MWKSDFSLPVTLSTYEKQFHEDEGGSLEASQVAQLVKNPPACRVEIRDVGLIPGLGISLGGGHGSPLQYSCLRNPMDRGAWWAAVYGVAQSWTRLK